MILFQISVIVFAKIDWVELIKEKCYAFVYKHISEGCTGQSLCVLPSKFPVIKLSYLQNPMIQWTYSLYNEQNFDLDKSRQTFHHSLKEHHQISNTPKFRCEML